MSRSALSRLQLRRLRRQISRCYEGSGFYREKFKRAQVKPKDIRSLDDIRKLPFVTKAELREEQSRHPPFGRYVLAPKHSWREIHPSTGTTGKPVNTIWSESDVESITEFTARTMWSFGTRPGHVVHNAFSYGLWVAGLSVHYAARRLGCLVIPIGAGLTERQMEYFQDARSKVLLSTPSFALYLAEKLRERGISPERLSLEMGCFGGEPGTEIPSTRRRIEEGLGIDAYDYYGLAEIGPTFASECTEKAGLHWSEDHHLIEIVDQYTCEPCSQGEVGVLVVTHLTREATPMIRYWTNDLARVELDKCGCGRTHARSHGGILGRIDDMIIYRGTKFYPAQVEKVVRDISELGEEFRIVLSTDPSTGGDLCTVMAEYKAEADLVNLCEVLKSRLKDELLVTPEVDLVKAGTFERTQFKAKRIVDERQARP